MSRVLATRGGGVGQLRMRFCSWVSIRFLPMLTPLMRVCAAIQHTRGFSFVQASVSCCDHVASFPVDHLATEVEVEVSELSCGHIVGEGTAGAGEDGEQVDDAMHDACLRPQ